MRGLLHHRPVRNLSHTERVEISAESGVVKVETEHRRPLTAAQRERAARIARNNETFQKYIATAENYTLTVEPVQKIDATAVNSVEINETRREMNPPNDTVTGNDSFVIVESTEQTNNDDTVAVAREPKYAADIVSVRLSGPDSNPRFSLRINLETERIVDITDWVDIRNNQTND